MRVSIARGPSIARLSDALAVDFGPHRGDPVLGGPDGSEGIQGPDSTDSVGSPKKLIDCDDQTRFAGVRDFTTR